MYTKNNSIKVSVSNIKKVSRVLFWKSYTLGKKCFMSGSSVTSDLLIRLSVVSRELQHKVAWIRVALPQVFHCF